MANLPLSYSKIGAATGTSGLKCHGKLTPGSNQKTVLQVRVKCKNTSTTPLWVEFRIRTVASGSVTGGTFSAASSWNKLNPADAETPRSTWQECTANPTVGGSPQSPAWSSADSQGEWVTRTIVVNASDVALLESTNISGTDVPFDYEVSVVE